MAVLVGLTSSIAIVFQAAQGFGATPAEISSWVWAIGVGVGLCTLIPSLIMREPFMVAWSTPGAAVLATAGLAGHFTMSEAIGAFILSAVLIIIAGATRWFERIMDKIPQEIAAALLAGVLARFGMQVFTAAQTALALIISMLLVYLLARRFAPRYAVVFTLLAGILSASVQGQMNWSAIHFGLAMPVFTMPTFTWQAFMSLALPLFVVTMASQNLPGVAVMRTFGYNMPVSRLITMTGVATLLLAPFGGYALNFSAITAAMCMGPEAHPDRDKRYTASVCSGIL